MEEESNGADVEQEVLQRNFYYSFGMKMQGPWEDLQPSTEQHYLYNGKERDSEFNLNWDHYGFRMYDASVGRFTGVDLISDQFAQLSIYNYGSNNPVVNVDLHGLQGVPFWVTAYVWWQSKKAEWTSTIDNGLSDMHQGSTNSNASINHMPINQTSKNLLHKAQANTGLVKAIKPSLDLLTSAARLHPYGAASFGLLDASMQANNGEYLAAAITLALIPLDMASDGVVSKTKVVGKGLVGEITESIGKNGLELNSVFKLEGKPTVGILADMEDAGNTLKLNNLIIGNYDGIPDDEMAGKIGRGMYTYMTALGKWAKDKGYSTLEFHGVTAGYATSKAEKGTVKVRQLDLSKIK